VGYNNVANNTGLILIRLAVVAFQILRNHAKFSENLNL